jgi:CrcB protein
VSAGVWIGVAVLGGVGALARFVIDAAVAVRAAGEFPFGTLVVNLSGALALGILGAAVSGTALVLAGTAAIGSYTTFSTWMLETHRLAEDGKNGIATANIIVSLILGVGTAALGRAIGHAL